MVFAHLAVIWKAPLPNKKLYNYLQGYDNLCTFCGRILQRYFPGEVNGKREAFFGYGWQKLTTNGNHRLVNKIGRIFFHFGETRRYLLWEVWSREFPELKPASGKWLLEAALSGIKIKRLLANELKGRFYQAIVQRPEEGALSLYES